MTNQLNYTQLAYGYFLTLIKNGSFSDNGAHYLLGSASQELQETTHAKKLPKNTINLLMFRKILREEPKAKLMTCYVYHTGSFK